MLNCLLISNIMENTLCILHTSTIWFFPFILEPNPCLKHSQCVCHNISGILELERYSTATTGTLTHHALILIMWHINNSTGVKSMPNLEGCSRRRCHTSPLLSELLSTGGKGVILVNYSGERVTPFLNTFWVLVEHSPILNWIMK